MDVGTFDITDGYWSETEQNWILYPQAKWKVPASRTYVEIGSAGVDGITFVLRPGLLGVYAYYPIEDTFRWVADTGRTLIDGWVNGRIKV